MSAFLDPKKDPARQVMKFKGWPVADQLAWEAALQQGDPFEPGEPEHTGPPKHRTPLPSLTAAGWGGWPARIASIPISRRPVGRRLR